MTGESLVGMFFHTWREPKGSDSQHATFRNGMVLEHQGHVVKRVEEECYVVELFSWWDGLPSDQKVVRAPEMSAWTFYEDAIAMQLSLGCREFDRDCPCRGEATHYADLRSAGLGLIFLCSNPDHRNRYPHPRPLAHLRSTSDLRDKGPSAQELIAKADARAKRAEERLEEYKRLRRLRDARRKEKRREHDRKKKEEKQPTITDYVTQKDWGILRVIFGEDTVGLKLVNLIAHPATPPDEREAAVNKLTTRRIRWQQRQTTSVETRNTRPATKSALSSGSSRGG